MHWTDHIYDVTSRDDYQTATLRLVDTSEDGEYDVDSGETTYPAGFDPVIYEGPARVIFPRWGTFSGGESQANSKTNSTARIQLPRTLDRRVARGTAILVLSSRNPALVGQWGRVTSDLQGSSMAQRTFECAWDSDNVSGDLP